jgi:hypothetical protein
LGSLNFFVPGFPELGTGSHEVEEEGEHHGQNGRGDENFEEGEGEARAESGRWRAERKLTRRRGGAEGEVSRGVSPRCPS